MNSNINIKFKLQRKRKVDQSSLNPKNIFGTVIEIQKKVYRTGTAGGHFY